MAKKNGGSSLQERLSALTKEELVDLLFGYELCIFRHRCFSILKSEIDANRLPPSAVAQQGHKRKRMKSEGINNKPLVEKKQQHQPETPPKKC